MAEKEYIERDKAIKAVSGWYRKALHPENMSRYNEGERAAYRTALSEIANLHAADVRPVVSGKWKRNERGNYNCSNCKSEHNAVFGFIFCPICGAMMGEN